MIRIVLEVQPEFKKKLKIYAAQTDNTIKEVLVEGALSFMKLNPPVRKK